MPQNDPGQAPRRRHVDLNSVRLSTVWRGYDPADVDRFVAQAASDYQLTLVELERLTARHAAVSAQLSDARGRERVLATTLSAAKESADAIRSRATAQAGRITEEAEVRAEHVVQPALSALDRIRAQIEDLVNSRKTIEATLGRSIESLRERRGFGPPAADAAAVDVEPAVAAEVDSPVEEERLAVPDVEAPSAPIAPPALLSAPPRQPRRSTGRFRQAVVPIATAAAALTSMVLVYQFRDRPAQTARPAPPTAAAVRTPDTRARAETPPPTQPAAPSPTVPSRAAAPSGTRRVVLATRRDCWMRAIVDGRKVLEGLVRAGGEIVLDFRDAAFVRAGDAGAVSLTLDGRPLGTLGRDGQIATRSFGR